MPNEGKLQFLIHSFKILFIIWFFFYFLLNISIYNFLISIHLFFYFLFKFLLFMHFLDLFLLVVICFFCHFFKNFLILKFLQVNLLYLCAHLALLYTYNCSLILIYYRLGQNLLIINKYAVRSRYNLWPIQLVKD